MAEEASSRLNLDQRFSLLEAENQRQQQQQERAIMIQELLAKPTPKIQKVPGYLRDRENFTQHYLPKLVSFGLIHHGDPKLHQGEKYKLMWSAMYVKRTKQNAREMHQRIVDNIKEIKDLFTEDLFAVPEFTNYESQGFKSTDEKLSWILFVDGCSMLQILDKGNLNKPSDYDELDLKFDQMILVQQDMLLLENQIPYQLLKLLSPKDDQNADDNLQKSMNHFLSTHHLWPLSTQKEKSFAPEDKKLVTENPAHLLDYFLTILVKDPNKGPNHKNPEYVFERTITHRNIKELTVSGIKVKKSDSKHWPNIEFSGGFIYGHLMLPAITVDDTTEPTLLNLIAYEMCPGFINNYEISSFVAFLDSLIDHPEDVKVLRDAGVLQNALGSDEEVSNLFNTISKDLVTSVGSYGKVRKGIEQHYKDKGKTWVNELIKTHFSTPWAITGFITAIIIVVFTFIQTAYTAKWWG